MNADGCSAVESVSLGSPCGMGAPVEAPAGFIEFATVEIGGHGEAGGHGIASTNDLADERDIAAGPDEGTVADETAEVGSDPSPTAGSSASSSTEAESAADVSAIFGPNRTKVMDLEACGVPLDVDAYKDMFPAASEEEDAALFARVRDMNEIIVDVAESGRVLDKRRTYQAAGGSGKKIKIKVRVHYGLNQKQEIEKRYQLNEGGRQPTPKQKRRIQRERVWNLFWMRNILGLTITLEFIARHTGYSLAWISKLEKEFLASNSSSSEKAVKRNLNRKMTPELVAKAKALIAQKTPIDEIAKELGVHPNTVRNWLQEPKTKARGSDAQDATGKGATSPVTLPCSTPIPAPALPLPIDIDEPNVLDEVFNRLEGSLGSIDRFTTLWRAAGRKLVAERLKACTDSPATLLKVAAQALVEFQAAAAAAEEQVEQLLLAAGKEGAA